MPSFMFCRRGPGGTRAGGASATRRQASAHRKKINRGAPQGAEVIQGDATDPVFCAQAAQGAATVYHCMNPPYIARLWAELVPHWLDNLIAAAAGRSHSCT